MASATQITKTSEGTFKTRVGSRLGKSGSNTSVSGDPNIVLSGQKFGADGMAQGAPNTTYYSGNKKVSKDVYEANSLAAGTKTINSSLLSPTSSIGIPSPSPTSTTGTNAMTMLAGTAAGAALNADASKIEQTTPTAVPTDLQTRLNAMLDIKRPKTEDIYKKTLKETGVNEKQALVNTYTGQLNAIVAKSQADKLALTGTGRGIPEVIIGGQQAQIDKEAAIQSLPIAAQLSAAQGDLAMAKDQMNTLFTIRSQDAKADYDFKVKMVDTVFNYADKQQQIALEDKRTKESQAFQMKTNSLNYAQSLATAAINNGQSSTAAALMRLDPKDPNYASNIASLAQNIQVAQKGSSSGSTGIGQPETQALLGVGYTMANIQNIAQGVQQYGFPAVYATQAKDGATKEQLATLEKTYGIAPKRNWNDINSAVTVKFAADTLKSSYTTNQLEKLAKDYGFGGLFGTGEKEIDKFLSSEKAREYYVAQLVAQEKAAGRLLQ